MSSDIGLQDHMSSYASTSPSIDAAQAGVVYLVGAGPGDPDLITVRGAQLLASADVVLHDELVHPAILEVARGEVRSVGKRGGDRASKQAKQAEIDRLLVKLARSGKSVVRLKGGDPFLFGRGSEEAEALALAEVKFEIVPGVPSPLGATAYAGISVTHRDYASSVTFVSGTTRAGTAYDFAELASVKGTICVLMGMHNIDDVAHRLIVAAKRSFKTPAAVIQWGTRAEQRVVLAPLGDIAEKARAARLGSPSIIVVGQVAELRESLRWFDKTPLFGKRVLVGRASEQASETARAVRQRGAEPIVIPLIAVDDVVDTPRIARAVSELWSYDVCAFTSENGVDRFLSAVRSAGKDARAFGRSRVAAIGPGTAASLLAHGISADIVPSIFRGEALAAAILADSEVAERLRARGSARALLPRAKVAREVLGETLRAKGVLVDVVPVYETRPLPEKAALLRALEARRVDVILLTSSSTADSIADAVADRKELLSGVVLASIGPITTETAKKRGLSVAVSARVSTIRGLLEALEEALASRPSTTT